MADDGEVSKLEAVFIADVDGYVAPIQKAEAATVKAAETISTSAEKIAEDISAIGPKVEATAQTIENKIGEMATDVTKGLTQVDAGLNKTVQESQAAGEALVALTAEVKPFVEEEKKLAAAISENNEEIRKAIPLGATLKEDALSATRATKSLSEAKGAATRATRAQAKEDRDASKAAREVARAEREASTAARQRNMVLMQSARAFSRMTEGMLDVARTSLEMENRLKGPFQGMAHDIAELSNRQVRLGFDPQSIATAMTTLHTFGADTEANLKRIEDAARGTGKSVEEMATKFARFAQQPTSKTLLQMQRELGVTTKDLVGFGARLDVSTGKIDLATEPRKLAAVHAMFEAMSRFDGAAERSASNTVKLKGAFYELELGFGEAAASMEDKMAPAFTHVLEGLNSLSPEIKGVIGIGLDLASKFAFVGAGALQAATNIAILSNSMKGGTIATTAYAFAQNAAAAGSAALTLGVLATVAAFGTLAVGLAVIIDGYNKAAIAAEELAQVELRRSSFEAKGQKYLGKSFSEVKAMGGDSKQMAREIDALQEQLEKATTDGEKKRLGDHIAVIRAYKTAFAEEEAKSKKANSKEGSIDDPSVKEKAKAAREAHKAELAAAREKRKAALEAKKAQKEDFDAALSEVRQLAEAKLITHAQEIAQLQEVLNLHAKTAQERRHVLEMIATLKGKLVQDAERDKKAAKAKEKADAAEDEHKRKEEFASALSQIHQLAAAKKITHAEEIQQLEHLLDTKRHNNAEDIRVLGEIARLKGQIIKDDEKAAAKKEKEEKKDDKAVEKAHKDTRAAKETQIDNDIQDNKDKFDETGENRIEAYRKLAQAKLNIEIEQVRAERDAALEEAKSDEARAAIKLAAEERIRAMVRDTTRIMKDEADKRKPKKDKENDPFAFGGKVLSVERMAAQVNAGWAGDSGEKKGTLVAGLYKFGEGANVKATIPPEVLAKTAETERTAAAIGKAVGDAVKAQAINIKVEVSGEGHGEHHFNGTAAELAAQRNIFNPDHQQGRA